MPHQPHKGKIVVFGILFWYPLAGVTFQFLHFLIGLRRLGYDVYYVEDSSRWGVYDPRLNDISPDASGNVALVAPVLQAHGFGDRWAFRGNYEGGRCYGMTEKDILRLYREADGFLNVTGAQELRDEHLDCPRRIYLETDPVASQIKVAQGDQRTIDFLAAHHVHFSYGENLGAPDCRVPIERFRWIPTRQPVVLDLWDNHQPEARAYSTIATWENKYKDIVWKGETYRWSKGVEFMKIIDLPRRRTVSFELAVGREDHVVRLLREKGWHWVDSIEVSRDLDRYKTFIQTSRGEFTVTKDQYVRLRSGWFSDRSACYLAASRPVITQETGFSNCLPTGQGLFAFEDMEDILAALDEIESDYERHCGAAREIAAEYFAAERVLGKVMRQAGL